MSSQGKRLTKPELEAAVRMMMPASSEARKLKRELASQRADFAEWLYNNSEPIDQSAPRHSLD